MGRCHIDRKPNDPTTAPAKSGDHFINTAAKRTFLSVGTDSVADWLLVEYDTDVKVKVAAADTVSGFLDTEITAGSTKLTKTIINGGADEKLELDVDETQLTITESQISDLAHTPPEVQATETVSGIAEIATQVETDAGTDDTRMITPLKLSTAPVSPHTHAHSDTTGQTANDHHNKVQDLAGPDHNSATLAELNAKVSDATLDDPGDSRPP